MQIALTGFLTSKTPEFMTALWKLLLEAQVSTGGIPKTFLEEKKEEMRRMREKDTRALDERDRRARLDEVRERERNERSSRGRGRGRGRGGRNSGPEDGNSRRGRDNGWGARGGGVCNFIGFLYIYLNSFIYSPLVLVVEVVLYNLLSDVLLLLLYVDQDDPPLQCIVGALHREPPHMLIVIRSVVVLPRRVSSALALALCYRHPGVIDRHRTRPHHADVEYDHHPIHLHPVGDHLPDGRLHFVEVLLVDLAAHLCHHAEDVDHLLPVLALAPERGVLAGHLRLI